MIGNNYKAHRDNVIDLCKGYLEKRKIFTDCTKVGDGIDLPFLERRIESLQKGKFVIAVAGEVKAGKSTFINALLGAELLPADVLQASSAIVEIFKSDRAYLKVKYADSHVEEIYDDLGTPEVDEAKEKLHEICKISDDFRDIPTTIIDQWIINSVEGREIDDNLIECWEKESSMNLSTKKDALNRYIRTRTKDKIPIEIQFGYPLKWNFDELRIVDSPGVNAVGGVQNVSFEYFENAHAILFVHPIKPIESETFCKFVKKSITNRSKETLFLVLTHSGLHPESEIEKLHDEAIRLFEAYIPSERILVVDSLLQLIVHDLENGKTQEEIEDESDQKSDIIPKFEKRAKKEKKSLKEILGCSSGFKKMYEAIDSFSMQAPNLQLREILQSIKDGYSQQEVEYRSRGKLLESKKRDPQEFENEISRINNKLEEYKLLMKKTNEEIKGEYTGLHTDWKDKIDKLKSKYPELITNSTDFEIVRKHLTDGENDINDIVDKFSEQLTEELKRRLYEIGESFQEDKKITLPKIDLQSLEDETKKRSFRKEDVYENVMKIGYKRKWFTLWLVEHEYKYFERIKSGEKQVYDRAEHLNSFKIECTKVFYQAINQLPQQIQSILEKFLNLFLEKMDRTIEDRQKALDNELKKKETNEELMYQINDLEKKKDLLPKEMQAINAILEDIK